MDSSALLNEMKQKYKIESDTKILNWNEDFNLQENKIRKVYPE